MPAHGPGGSGVVDQLKKRTQYMVRMIPYVRIIGMLMLGVALTLQERITKRLENA